MVDSYLDLGGVGQGFADPVETAQDVFRLVLDATARPGRVVTLPDETQPGGVLSPAAVDVALTLLDYETPVWLDLKLTDAAPFLRFHCSAPLVTSPKDSRFAFAAGFATLPPLNEFDLGTEEYPDRSTTLIVEVPELIEGSGLTLRGPGIKDTTRLLIGCVPAEFWRARADLAALFPLGIDLLLTSGRLLAALPRTTVVEA
jgi:alpha-D-ribose 1-methylphosphonate 5-triphosphate synthase subunit PhnH